MTISELLTILSGKLIVSCQAEKGDAFYGRMDLFAKAALQGGAGGIRANGASDVRAVCAAVPLPVIGIEKSLHTDGRILITPTFDAAKNLVEAGAHMIALDCTRRGRDAGAFESIRRIKTELRIPVLADIATLDEAIQAEMAGADLILSTLRGYTDETPSVHRFEPEFIRALARTISVPVIAEGRIDTPDQAREAIRAGALAVVIGSAITRPHEITTRFVSAIQAEARTYEDTKVVIAVDLGGTNTKFGVVTRKGELLFQDTRPTPAKQGRRALMNHLVALTGLAIEQCRDLGREPDCAGIATAGWVDADTGAVVYATENLPEWTGTPIAKMLGTEIGIPVFVENDANALAIGEHLFGSAQSFRNFVCITVGTGIGGGCFLDGRLHRGAHFFANALGHIPIETAGRPCNCGQSGCLEVYANAAALLAYAGGEFHNCESLIQAASDGNATAEDAIKHVAKYLASGCAILLQLLDPEALVLGGGVAEENRLLFETLEHELSGRIPTWAERNIQILPSSLGYYSGVLGAAAVALEHGTA